MEKLQIKSVIIDTLNNVQNTEMVKVLKVKKTTYDDWRDWGVDISYLMYRLQEIGFEVVLVLGFEGSGKTYGIKTLNLGEYVWFNTDKKNATFLKLDEAGKPDKNFKRLYGTKSTPGPLMKVHGGYTPKGEVLPISFDSIVKDCDALQKGIKTPDFEIILAPNPVAFLIGHLAEVKGPNGEIRLALKVLGKMPTKMQIAGLVETCLISEMKIEGNKPIGSFLTQNDGTTTARSPEGMFPSVYIPNDYQYVVNAIDNYRALYD
jgi:hypothetical protein